jgi:hypothetical protein
MSKRCISVQYDIQGNTMMVIRHFDDRTWDLEFVELKL